MLAKLRLTLSPSKTKMGKLDSTFHFLGANFEVARTPQSKPNVSVSVHPRTCARAHDRVKAMHDDAVHPATQQRYLVQWASWWSHTIKSNGIQTILLKWMFCTMVRAPTMAWLGRGLLAQRLIQSI